jgi:hypothetical protein
LSCCFFWYGERTQNTQHDGSIAYYNCCKGGKVSIPPYKPRSEPLASLAKFDGDSTAKKFMQHIQYNWLFTFTSMSAHIDDLVNDCYGPPLFKTCG